MNSPGKLEDLQGLESCLQVLSFQKSMEQEKIPLGIFYQTQRDTYHEGLDQIKNTPLVFQDIFNISI